MSYSDDLQPIKNLDQMQFWCQKVLPLVFDDSLSYLETVSKMATFLNNTITQMNTNSSWVGAMIENNDQWITNTNADLFNWLTGMENVGIDERIVNNIQTLLTDGTIEAFVNKTVLVNMNNDIDIFKVDVNQQIATIDGNLNTFKNETNTQLADKASQLQLSEMVGGKPKDFYTTLSDLQTAHPTNDGFFYVVGTTPGLIYVWRSDSWTNTNMQYSASGNADNSIINKMVVDKSLYLEKLNDTIKSSNLFSNTGGNKDVCFSPIIINNRYQEVTLLNAYICPDFPCLPNMAYTFKNIYHVVEYSKDSIAVKMNQPVNVLTTIVTSPTTYFMSCDSTLMLTEKSIVNLGSVILPYEDGGFKLKRLLLNDGIVKKNNLDSATKNWIVNDAILESCMMNISLSSNILNLTRGIENFIFSGGLTSEPTAALAGACTSLYIKVEPNVAYHFEGVFHVIESSDMLVPLVYTYFAGSGGNLVMSATTKYIRVDVTASTRATAQINKGTVKLPYEPFYYRSKNILPNIASVGIPELKSDAFATIANDAIVESRMMNNSLSSNILNLTRGIENFIFSGGLTSEPTAALAGACTSLYIKVEPNVAYHFEGVFHVIESSDMLVPLVYTYFAGSGGNLVMSATTKYIRVDVTASTRATAQINKGTVKLPYEPFYYRSKNILPNIASVGIPELKSDVLALMPVSTSKSLTVTKSGINTYIRNKWDDTLDFVENMNIDPGRNRLINFGGQWLFSKNEPSTGVSSYSLKLISDDICPINIEGSFVGANHGWNFVYQATITGHGLTVADIGKPWTQEAKTFYVASIIDANNLLFIGEQKETNPVSFEALIVSTITNGILTLSITVVVNTQWYPSVKNISRTYLVDGNAVTSDGDYSCDEYIISESYDICDVSSMLTHLKNNVGVVFNQEASDIMPRCRVMVNYCFNRNGSCVVKNDIKFYLSSALYYIGGIQSQNIYSQYSVFEYIPNSVNWETPKAIASDSIDKVGWKDQINPPNRFISYPTNGTIKINNYGFTGGYNTDIGTTKASLRKNNGSAIIISTVLKNYPYAVDVINKSVIQPNEVIEILAFRCPINYNFDIDATNISWYWVGKDIYLMLDYHKTVNKFLKLPSYMMNKKVTVVEKSTNFSCSTEYVNFDGINIAVTNFGYAILKLT